ncbi:MAG TPA: phosphatase PAP2 family protein, partial [Burkholderiales bacterium]|nr:phosphatase PAP2 family protein [Burkholderiales bacterium]
DVLPALRLPLRAAASVVAFSRVYTGAHYPSDVLVGATMGALLGRLTSRVALHLRSPGIRAVDVLQRMGR